MPFYQLPRLNEVVKWLPDQPATVVRFTATGGLVLLHATHYPALTPKVWQTQPLRLALSGTAFKTSPVSMEVPPMLSLRLGNGAPLIAPICIFELGGEENIYQWLNARPMPAELRLVLLRLDDEQPGRATVEASRRIWAPEWASAAARLRLRLERQCLDTPEAEYGQVQFDGRAMAVPILAGIHLELAGFRFDVPGEGPGERLIPTDDTTAIESN